MSELRKDYLLDHYVIINEKRSLRPSDFSRAPIVKAKVDFFAPGNEHLTPEEIGRISKGKSWQMRWFENKFPILDMQKHPLHSHRLYREIALQGHHEILVETPSETEQLSSFSEKRLTEVLQQYKKRMVAIQKKKGIKYVVLFKNEGKEAGASLAHSHTQIIGMTRIPQLVEDKAREVKKYKKCPYCVIAKRESKSTRAIFSNKQFCVFAPYASRVPWEAWIMPRTHKTSLSKMTSSNLGSLAEAMHVILSKLHKADIPFNFIFFYGTKGANIHFHIEFLPRTTAPAGFEFGTNYLVNPVAPESAAKFYRGER